MGGHAVTDRRLSTGVDGLDSVLQGGLIPGRSYLVRGDPGTGKTILGCHFLLEGVRQAETTLFINLEESAEDIKQNATALDFDLDAVEFLDLSPSADVFFEDKSYTVFEASDVEREPFAESVTDAVEAIDPDRIFVDPITRLRHLTRDDRGFRKQAIGFLEYLTRDDATVLFTSQHTASSSDEDLQFLSDGTIELGDADRGQSISVPKFRGSAAQSGTHAMEISDEGMVVYPALQPDEHTQQFVAEPLSSGVPGLDELLHGGIERGTVTVISGPTGVGKTTLGTHFMKEAAARGERSVIYLFEENMATFHERSESVDVPVAEMCEQGSLYVEEMEPLQLSPQQFAGRVRQEVEEQGADIVMIDGIDGYRVSVRGPEDELTRRLHALSRYLKNMGVTVILVDETYTVTGDFSATGAKLSYLADNIVVLQHIEHQGTLRKIGGVLKKRTSNFERSLREFEITEDGLSVGEPLTGLRGILSGTPEWESPRTDD